MAHKIGTKVRTLVELPGVPVGTIGYVFDEYPDIDIYSKTGVQVIFENGEYHGFSYAEQKSMLGVIKREPRYSHYRFRSVMWLMDDYRGGYWSFA